jgi:hypothetical protein
MSSHERLRGYMLSGSAGRSNDEQIHRFFLLDERVKAEKRSKVFD